jgi:Bacterial SH3 domain/Glycine zipper
MRRLDTAQSSVTKAMTLAAAFAAPWMAALAAAAPLPAAAQAARPTSGLFSCEASGNKQEGAALAGAAIGALLGSQVSKNERGLGAVAGAAIGAAAGSAIGCRMQSTDQARARAAVNAALANGSAQTWANPQTGASGRVDVLSESYGPPVDPRNIRFAGGVSTLASYDSMAGQFYAPGAINVRSGPSTSAAIVTKLKAGSTVDALGRVPGSNWLLVGQGGPAIGYVSQSVLRASGPAPTPACRTIRTTYSTRGYSPTVETYNACRDARGQWLLTNA